MEYQRFHEEGTLVNKTISRLILRLSVHFLFSMLQNDTILSGSGVTIPFWDFAGSTMVTNNHIRITPDVQSTIGSLWNSVVIQAFFTYISVSRDDSLHEASQYLYYEDVDP